MAGPLHNLPGEPSSFVGRTAEVKAVASLVAENPLVTLTGAGGCGKTRLALRVASQAAPSHPDGTFFVDLPTVAHGDFVAAAIARELGVDAHPKEAVNALADRLSDRDSLLVLDNCEQVVEDVALVCRRLTSAAPALRLLAASRERLGVPGEVVYTVPPLEVPPADAEPDAIEWYDAVRLFVERARPVARAHRGRVVGALPPPVEGSAHRGRAPPEPARLRGLEPRPVVGDRARRVPPVGRSRGSLRALDGRDRGRG